MFSPKAFESFLTWQSRHITHRQLVYTLSIVIGVLSGLAAVILKNTVFYTRYFLTRGFNASELNYLYLVFPFFGILLTVLFINYFVKENVTHGISRILWFISWNSGKMKKHDTYSSLIGSTITVGFGGSVGLEAPIVLTGSSIGSGLGRLFKQDYKTLLLFIGCGAAGAIASIFKAPIAGVLFSLEVLMLDLTMMSVIPLLLSAITGSVMASIFMGKSVLFSFTIVQGFSPENIPFFILLGILCGFISLYFTRSNQLIESSLQKIRQPWIKLGIGGIALSILIFFFPPLFGEGYETLKDLLNGHGSNLADGSLFYGFHNHYLLFCGFILLVLLMKVVAMAVTTGSGGVGGVFAPSLFVGGLTGFFLARLMTYFHISKIPENHFVLAGMAGLMSGVMHAPLTAIFLIAEITGGYELFIPLMITATLSFITIIYFEPHSIYTKMLAAKGELLGRSKDKAVLSQMQIDGLIETNFNSVRLDDYLGDLVKEVSKSERNIFPVVDRENNFYGIVFINDVREILFKQELYGKILVKDLMFMPKIHVEIGESMHDVVKKFEQSDKYNLPVLKDGKYIGFVSRANFFTAYREMMKEISEE